jgi:hypothetical protein
LPLTHPADARIGFIVSDRFHRRGDRAAVLDARPAISPARIDDVARAALAAEQKSAGPESRVPLDLLPQTGESGSTVEADRLHHLLATRLGAAEQVRLLAVRYAGLDAVAHYYLRYANPGAFGDVSEGERRQFGRVLDDYYGYVDSLVGDALSSLGENDLLVVVSGFGMEPLTFGKRLLERVIGDPRFTGTHERAPDGFLIAYGAPSLQRGKRAARSWTSRRRCCISSAFPWRAIWTDSCGRISLRARSTNSGPSRSSRHIGFHRFRGFNGFRRFLFRRFSPALDLDEPLTNINPRNPGTFGTDIIGSSL